MVATVLVGLFLAAGGIARFYTDFLWFDSLGFAGVWRSVLASKIVLSVVFTGFFFTLLFLNLLIADRLAPKFRVPGPEEDFLHRYQQLVGRRTGLVRAGVAFAFALIAGAGTSAQWRAFLLFTHAQDFGVDDPQFGMDVGFYIFRLPFLSFVLNWLFASFVIVLVVTAVAHYLNGGIRLQVQGERVTRQVKAHLSVLLGMLALLRAAGYFLQQYELTLSTRGFVDGAGATDVEAQLPAIRLLILVSLLAFVLLIVNIRQKGWKLPIIAVGLWGLVAVVAGTLFPAFWQRFTVQPAESTRELPFIERNIAATKAAMNLDEVTTQQYPVTEDLDAAGLATGVANLENARLQDPNISQVTFQRLQGNQGYFQFNDIDTDRYTIDGRTTQVVIGARELNFSAIPNQSWVGRFLTYTHGFGAVVARANRANQGRPEFLSSDLPPTGQPEQTQPEIYFGERQAQYALVATDRAEESYPTDDGPRQTRYSGTGGVEVGSFLRRMAFAIRFQDFNILISDLIRPESRILFQRDIRGRVQELAPFLDYDADPYPVVYDGRIVWVLDAYTTTDRYPYAQRALTTEVSDASDLRRKTFNYVRNSVKAVVDAYDGTVSLYVIDEDDPLVAAYREMFPQLFKPASAIPAGLEQHFRYPEDLFRVQTNMWGRYHQEDAAGFFTNSDGWSVAQDPGTTQQGANQVITGTTLIPGQQAQRRDARVAPIYQLLQLPFSQRTEFVLTRSFVPFSENDQQAQLAAFMAASSEWDSYGRLTVYTTPRGTRPDGPRLVANRIQANSEISRELSLLDSAGSSVTFGNLLLLPIDSSIVWVRPVFVQAGGQNPNQSQSSVPELAKVIVVYGERSVMRNTLAEALTAMFGSAPDLGTGGNTAPDGGGGGGGTGGGGDGGAGVTTTAPPQVTSTTAPGAPSTTSPPPSGTVDQLLATADRLYGEAQAALRAGDLATYQQRIDQAFENVRLAQQLSAVATTTTTAAPPTTASG